MWAGKPLKPKSELPKPRSIRNRFSVNFRSAQRLTGRICPINLSKIMPSSAI
jgi:hypothetical protein